MNEKIPHQPKMHIGLTGDVMIGRLVNQFLAKVPPEYIWGNLLPVLKSLVSILSIWKKRMQQLSKEFGTSFEYVNQELVLSLIC